MVPIIEQANNFSLRDYFERIGYAGEINADIATVTAIMQRQLRTVPFENLDVQAGKIVSLVPEEIVEKIVYRRRGGYCYEVNGLFAMAMQALGVPYQLVAARPRTYPTRRPKTHMVLALTLDGKRWLCDLGFGSHGIRAPLSLDTLGVEIRQDYDTYSLVQADEGVHLLRTIVDGTWVNQYEFDLSSQEWIDFVPANHLNSTHPDAIFVQHLVVVQQTDEGRKILFDNTFKVIARGRTEQCAIAQDEREAVLLREFGLVMPQ
ncbi:arylamine N-acetyltransferase [Trinickia sp. LjRoot230]|uniref:arylamine N-acetyltransferase family protein n=1 Tax=Trinickia sp. LjRoot230 TaxID=3342288 RepID=UPI003ECC4D9E